MAGGLWMRKPNNHSRDSVITKNNNNNNNKDHCHLHQNVSPGNSVSETLSLTVSEEEDDENEYTEQDEVRTSASSPPNSMTQTTSAASAQISTPPLFFRPIQVSDRDNVKRLHEEWFPVTYQDEFYDDLARGHLAGAPLFTQLAVCQQQPLQTRKVTDDTFEMMDEETGLFSCHGEQPPKQQGDAVQSVLPDTHNLVLLDVEHNAPESRQHNNSNNYNNYNNQTNNNNSPLETSFCHVINHHDTDHHLETEVIAGCVVGSFLPCTRLPRPLQKVLISDPMRHHKLFYIMTLGTISDFRGHGLGTRLVQECIKQVQQDPTCGACYLHVITHNDAAICLYEKLGFYRVQEIADYYDIDGQKYPCYLYAKYFHGNAGHLDLYKWIASCVWSFFQQILSFSHVSHLLQPSNSHSNDPNDYDGL